VSEPSRVAWWAWWLLLAGVTVNSSAWCLMWARDSGSVLGGIAFGATLVVLFALAGAPFVVPRTHDHGS